MDDLSNIYAAITKTSLSCRPQSSHHSLMQWLQAIVCACRAVAAFDRGGSPLALQCLRHPPGRPSLFPLTGTLPQTRQASFVQRDAAVLIAWMRLMTGGRACFSESIALCAGLRRLGWECSVVVAHACVELYAATPMHAWVEYHGIPINESIEVRYSYIEIQRLGNPMISPM